MAINFPSNPSLNETYTLNGKAWTWTGSYWKRVSADVPSALPSLTVTGDFTVQGASTTISTTELVVEDNIITLNAEQTGTPALNAGIEVERGDSDNVSLRWNEATDVWEFGNPGPGGVLYQPMSHVPTGTIVVYSGASAPTGWLLCDGSAALRSTWSGLFDVIGTTYGAGDGSTTFNVPNLNGRVPAGLDISQTEFDSLGKTGGAKTHTLSTSEMPSHAHNAATNAISTSNSGNSSNTYVGTPVTSNGAAVTNTGNQSANHTHGTNNQSAGHTHAVSGNQSANHTHSTPNHNHSMSYNGAVIMSNGTGLAYMNNTGAYGPFNIVNISTAGGGAGNTGGNSANHSHGNTGGISANHSHNTGNQSASHSHTLSHQHNMAHTHSISHTHTVTLGNAGSDTAHNNLQPYITLNYIIKG
jgi:microcystin-dependent protein